jgi:hypothetical protein
MGNAGQIFVRSTGCYYPFIFLLRPAFLRSLAAFLAPI